MAKTSMRPEVKAQKLKNNKVRLLICSEKDCENEFYIATFNSLGQSKRQCHDCYDGKVKKQAVTKQENTKLLASLGLL